MRIARGIFIRLYDNHDRAAAREAGLEIKQEKLGNYPLERMSDVVVANDDDHARTLISQLNTRACTLRAKAKRQATARQEER